MKNKQDLFEDNHSLCEICHDDFPDYALLCISDVDKRLSCFLCMLAVLYGLETKKRSKY